MITHQIDLVRARICPVSCHQTKQRVLRRLRDSISWEAGRECRGRHLVGDAPYPVGGVGRGVVGVVSLGLRFVVGVVGRGRHPFGREERLLLSWTWNTRPWPMQADQEAVRYSLDRQGSTGRCCRYSRRGSSGEAASSSSSPLAAQHRLSAAMVRIPELGGVAAVRGNRGGDNGVGRALLACSYYPTLW